jgi:hypothetical protein
LWFSSAFAIASKASKHITIIIRCRMWSEHTKMSQHEILIRCHWRRKMRVMGESVNGSLILSYVYSSATWPHYLAPTFSITCGSVSIQQIRTLSISKIISTCVVHSRRQKRLANQLSTAASDSLRSFCWEPPLSMRPHQLSIISCKRWEHFFIENRWKSWWGNYGILR